MISGELGAGQPVALVTGAGSGIGAGIAEYLAQAGYYVLISDVAAAPAQARVAELVSRLLERGYQAAPAVLDVTSQRDIETLTGRIDDELGRVDLLVNNAGLQHVARLEDFPPDRWRLINEVLLVGPAMLTRALLPLMRAKGFGRIVNIGSIHGLVASPYKSAYVAAKHGLLGFAKVVALETAEQDITINTICPSYVKTPLVEQQIQSQAREHGISEEQVINTIMLAPMPKQCFISIEEICECLSYLASNGARNITAQSLVIDGGWTAR